MTAPFPSFTKVWHTETYPAISSSRPELSAKGKTILVTGGGTGIGASIAKSFASAGAAKVILIGRTATTLKSTQEEIQLSSPGVEVVVSVADVRDETAVNTAFHSFGDIQIDVLVSNAGYGVLSSIKNMNIDKAWEVVETNMKGSLIITKAFLAVAASDAVVVNIASNCSHVAVAPGISSYASSKAGAVRFFDALQEEHPELRVISIQPGVIETPLSRTGGFPGLDQGKLKPPQLPSIRKSRAESHSNTSWRLCCVACKSRGGFLKREVCLGELGRRRDDFKEGRNSKQWITNYQPGWLAI